MVDLEHPSNAMQYSFICNTPQMDLGSTSEQFVKHCVCHVNLESSSRKPAQPQRCSDRFTEGAEEERRNCNFCFFQTSIVFKTHQINCKLQ